MIRPAPLLAALLLAGCSEDPETTLATVAIVHCEPRGGNADCRTVVELPDRRRLYRGDKWGKVGDTILVAVDKYGQAWYTP